MKGSEKQVAWAEDIRAEYAAKVSLLEEIIAILSDTTQEAIVENDPLFGDFTRMVYTTDTTDHQDAVLLRTTHWAPGGKDLHEATVWMMKRKEEIGGEHRDRLTRRDKYVETLKNLEKALAEEDDARYWIDRR